jgi:hypothetical protein
MKPFKVGDRVKITGNLVPDDLDNRLSAGMVGTITKMVVSADGSRFPLVDFDDFTTPAGATDWYMDSDALSLFE